jgi:hypothetical protein
MDNANSPKKPPRKPKKLGRPKGSKNKKASSSVGEEHEQEFCELEEALTDYLKQQSRAKNKSINNIRSLETLLNQYLNSFILIGYSQDTKEFVSIVNAKNEQSADSLSTALNKFIVNSTKRPPTTTDQF